MAMVVMEAADNNAAATSSLRMALSLLGRLNAAHARQSCAEPHCSRACDASDRFDVPAEARMHSAKPGNDVAIMSASSTVTGSFEAMPSTRNDIATR